MRSASVIDILGGANTLCSLAHSSITPVPRDDPGRNVRNPAARWPWGQERLALALGRIGPSSSTSAPRSNDMLAALTSRTIEKVLQSLVATRLLGASLHALSRDHPQLAVQINLAPSRAECLAGAGGGEDRKPKLLGAGRAPLGAMPVVLPRRFMGVALRPGAFSEGGHLAGSRLARPAQSSSAAYGGQTVHQHRGSPDKPQHCAAS